MSLKEQTIILTDKDSQGNTIMQFPITKAKNIEDVMSIAQGGTGATSAISALSNLGILDAIVNASVSGKTITFTKKDNTKFSIDTQDTNNGIVAALLKQNGYVKFSNGLILQWGRSTAATLNFSLSFQKFYCITTAQESWGSATFENTSWIVRTNNSMTWPTYRGTNINYIAVGM